MPWVQEAVSHEEYDRSEPTVQVVGPCQADDEERFDRIRHEDSFGEKGSRRLRRTPIPWLVRESPTVGVSSAGEETSRGKSPVVSKAHSPGARNQGRNGRKSAPRLHSVGGQPLKTEPESIESQIRRFQERADLRECLLPGMVGRISRKACEGRQRQTALRNSRMLAKIKLESCQDCPHRLQRDPSSA